MSLPDSAASTNSSLDGVPTEFGAISSCKSPTTLAEKLCIDSCAKIRCCFWVRRGTGQHEQCTFENIMIMIMIVTTMIIIMIWGLIIIDYQSTLIVWSSLSVSIDFIWFRFLLIHVSWFSFISIDVNCFSTVVVDVHWFSLSFSSVLLFYWFSYLFEFQGFSLIFIHCIWCSFIFTYFHLKIKLVFIDVDWFYLILCWAEEKCRRKRKRTIAERKMTDIKSSELYTDCCDN